MLVRGGKVQKAFPKAFQRRPKPESAEPKAWRVARGVWPWGVACAACRVPRKMKALTNSDQIHFQALTTLANSDQIHF